MADTTTPNNRATELLGQAKLDLESAQTVYDCAPACFFSQQASEKYLKAFLCFHGVDFRQTHDLVALLKLCEMVDRQFDQLLPDAELMKPFAVDVRYKSESVALANRSAAVVMHASWRIREFVMERLPSGMEEFDRAPR